MYAFQTNALLFFLKKVDKLRNDDETGQQPRNGLFNINRKFSLILRSSDFGGQGECHK